MNLVESDVNRSRKRVKSHVVKFTKSMKIVEKITSSGDSELLAESVLAHYQGILVRELHELVDDCYLRLLMEVLNGKNLDRISLQKVRVQVDLSDSMPLPSADGGEEARGDWLNLGGLVTDIWQAYKFEAFEQKMSMLLKPIKFLWPIGMQMEFRKHVLLRNCMQHHGGEVNGHLLEQFLQQTTSKKLEIRAKPTPVALEKWKPIIFTCDEVLALAETLLKFADAIVDAVEQRMPKTKEASQSVR